MIFILNLAFIYRTSAPTLANIRSGSITLAVKGSILEWVRHGMHHPLQMALRQGVHKLRGASLNIGNILVP